MKKGIRIDSTNKTITEVEVGEGIDDIYKHVGCSTFEVVQIDDPEENSCYVDEEALCKAAYIDEDGVKHNMNGFRIKDWPHPIIGNGLVLGFDYETGESGDSNLTIKEVQNLVTFFEYDKPEDRPEPQCGFVAWSD